MADITMCSQSLCPNAGHCYRATATPSLYWQSVQSFDYTISADGVVCGSYWPTHKYEFEAIHYAAQYQQDGPVRVFEVTRTPIDAGMKREREKE